VIWGWPPSIAAITEFVVPRSIPTALLIARLLSGPLARPLVPGVAAALQKLVSPSVGAAATTLAIVVSTALGGIPRIGYSRESGTCRVEYMLLTAAGHLWPCIAADPRCLSAKTVRSTREWIASLVNVCLR
jgi:hypothetical protein